MVYKSKLKIAIKLEEMRMKEIEKNLSILYQEFNEKNKYLNKLQSMEHILYKKILKGEIKKTTELFGLPDKKVIEKLITEIKILEQKINEEKKKYEQVNEKKKYIEKLDIARKKEFLKKIDIKNQKEIEEIKINLKIQGRG